MKVFTTITCTMPANVQPASINNGECRRSTSGSTISDRVTISSMRGVVFQAE